jgi:thiosulfate/3-mercaptopyruvate sulfurtransferase
MTTMPPVVSVDDLSLYPDAVLADVRWYLDGRDARAIFESGHLPGAIFIDLDQHLAGHGQPPSEGRHPFPSPADFAESMSSLGIGDNETVIAYDDTGGMTAGRLVVMLRMLGRNAALLDGGLEAWHGELMTGPGSPRDADVFTACEWPIERFASADETAALAMAADGLVLDARSHERYTGQVTLIDPRPGHIPGAVSAPFAAAINASTKHLRSADELRDHFNELGVSESTSVVTYCGSGVSACVNILAMEQAGLPPARLYVASFSGWSSDPARDVEMGDGR